ncbi:MAG: hypothetical protein ACREPL_10290 [Rhodanobacteraceae bacterium]
MVSIFNAWPYRELWKSPSFRGHRRLCRRWNLEFSGPWGKSWIPGSARDGAGRPGMTTGIVELQRESGRAFDTTRTVQLCEGFRYLAAAGVPHPNERTAMHGVYVGGGIDA